MLEEEEEHEKEDDLCRYRQDPLLVMYGANEEVRPRVDAHILPNNDARPSTHAAFLDPDGRPTHEPPAAAHAASQL